MQRLYIDEAEQICANCANWDLAHQCLLPVWAGVAEKSPRHYAAFAPCRACALELDAGEALPMLGGYGHCRFHASAFAPADAYLESLKEQEARERDLAELRGFFG